MTPLRDQMRPFLSEAVQSSYRYFSVHFMTFVRHLDSKRILLQVWAYEKLGLVAPVSDDQIGCYRSNHFQRCRMLINFRHDWDHSIMPFTNARFIRWTCPWWRLSRMTVETHLVRYVIYCSLSHSMAYFPDRIARQFMQTQGIPVLQSFAVSPLSRLLIERMNTRWTTRVRHLIVSPRDVSAVPGYVDWLQSQEG